MSTVASNSKPSNNGSSSSQFTPTLGCLIRVFAIDFFQKMQSNPAVWGLCAVIPGFSIFLMVVSRGVLKPQLFMVTLPLTVGMLPAAVLAGIGDLRPNYLLPVSTKRLLIARLLVAMGYVFIITLINSVLVMLLVANVTDWPNIRVAVSTAFLVPGWLMVGWAFRESTGYRILAGLLAVFGLITMLFFVMNHNGPRSRLLNLSHAACQFY